MATLKDKLETDMRTSMKARDELRTSTLKMVLTAVRNFEVAGKPRPRRCFGLMLYVRV